MRTVIVGAGSLGFRTARLLVARGHEVVLVERERSVIDELADALDCGLLEGDGTRPAVLQEADPDHADVLLCLTGNDQTNLIASLVGRSLGFPRVITRIEEEEFEHIAIELGLESSVIPSRTIGRYLADAVEGRDVLELSGAIKGDARVFVFVAREEDEVVLRDLALPEQAHVVHLYRDGEFQIAEPDTRLRRGDEVVVVAHRKSLDALRERWVKSPGARSPT